MARMMTAAFAFMMVIVGVPVLVCRGGYGRKGILGTIRQDIFVRVHEEIQLDQGRAESQKGDQSPCDDFHALRFRNRHARSTPVDP